MYVARHHLTEGKGGRFARFVACLQLGGGVRQVRGALVRDLSQSGLDQRGGRRQVALLDLHPPLGVRRQLCGCGRITELLADRGELLDRAAQHRLIHVVERARARLLQDFVQALVELIQTTAQRKCLLHVGGLVGRSLGRIGGPIAPEHDLVVHERVVLPAIRKCGGTPSPVGIVGEAGGGVLDHVAAARSTC